MWRNNQYLRTCQVETSYFDNECVPDRPVVETVHLFTFLLVQCRITGAFVKYMRRETAGLHEIQYSKVRQRRPLVHMLRSPDTWMTHTAHKKDTTYYGVKTFKYPAHGRARQAGATSCHCTLQSNDVLSRGTVIFLPRSARRNCFRQ